MNANQPALELARARVGRRDGLLRISDVLLDTVEGVAAVLVVLEVALLFTGIVARYGLHSPLTWSDELASVLFLWLAMLGSVVALRRGDHMRMTVLVSKVPESVRLWLEAIALGAALTFLVLVAAPGFEFAATEREMSMPGLDISSLWRAAAMPVGVLLMIFVAALRLVACAPAKIVAGAAAVLAAIAAATWLAAPTLQGLGNINLVIFFVGLLSICVLAGVPIAFAFGLATFSYLSASTSTPLEIVVGRMSEGMSHIILLSVPMFVLLGLLIEVTGMARSLIGFLASMLGHVRGGLSYVLIGAMYLISGISGSKAADMAAIAPALFPEMRKRGNDPGELVALLSATGAQTETIPPSLVLITVGSVTGVSISALFTGGLMPAVVVGLMLCVVVWWRNRKQPPGPQAAAAPDAGQQAAMPSERFSRSAVARSFVVALPALALPFIIRAAVVEGIATATEVSTIGIVYALVVGVLVYGRFPLARVKPMLVETAALSGAILLIIGCATSMAWALTQSGFSGALADAVAGLPGGRTTFILVSIVGFVLLGSVLEGIPAMVLFGPLMFPIAQQVGVHEVHYAMIVILSMGIGLFAPPFGVGYYTACAVGKIDSSAGLRPLIPYLITLFIGVLLIAAVPWFSTGFLAR